MKTLSMALTLFLLMDPLGNVPLFISILKHISPSRQRKIILRELLIALFVMIVFYFLGEGLLQTLNVESYTVLIAGGIILFLIALKMVFPSSYEPKIASSVEKEPFIVPLAIPFVAGPAVLAAIMLYAGQEENFIEPMGAITLAWMATTVVLLASSFLQRILGWRGLVACEKLMGLILTLLSVQMFLEGVTSYLHTVHAG